MPDQPPKKPRQRHDDEPISLAHIPIEEALRKALNTPKPKDGVKPPARERPAQDEQADS